MIAFSIFHVSEAYFEPSRTSTMELSVENDKRLKAANYFHKKAPSWMFDWALNMALKGFIMKKNGRKCETSIMFLKNLILC